MVIVENEFNIGETVYLRTDVEQLPRVVTAISFTKRTEPRYQLMSGVIVSGWHNELELSKERDVSLVLGFQKTRTSD